MNGREEKIELFTEEYVRDNTYLCAELVGDGDELDLYTYIADIGVVKNPLNFRKYLLEKENQQTEKLFDCLSSGYILYSSNEFYFITNLDSLESLFRSSSEILDIK